MRDAITALAPARGRSQHPGLLLQRYLSHPADGSERWANEKRELLRAAREVANDGELRGVYKATFDRWEKTLPTDPPPVDLTTDGRLVVGLGTESVLETGIRLHHTYGLPVIPGSALKGLAAHYCDEVWGQRNLGDDAPIESKRFRRPTKEEDEAYRKYLKNQGPKPGENYHRLLFGTTDDSGGITFHDAWLVPDSASPLVFDVMTPHHPDWLDGKKAPTDFDSPIPVAFVSVTGMFRVAVSWNGPAEHPQSKNWTQLVLELLKDALREWGVGGKTRSGYGRLVEPKNRTKPATETPTASTATAPRSARHRPAPQPKSEPR